MTALDWIFSYRELLAWLGLASALVFVAGLVVAHLWAVHLPADFFSIERERQRALRRATTASAYLVMLLRNLLGFLLVLLGVAMLILPGPGLLAIVVGILAMDFPGKMRLARWMVARPVVLSSINWIRGRAGRPPLQMDAAQ